jgi:hypothetical protein
MLPSSVENSEGRGNGGSGDSFADPCQEFKEGFFGVSPLFNHFLGYIQIYQRVI